MEWTAWWRREGAVSRGRGIDVRTRTSGDGEIRDVPDLIITPPFLLYDFYQAQEISRYHTHAHVSAVLKNRTVV